ncbi:hypothetical protein L7F22_031037 [Adiantum nelumboides]|nr:hypothetical protein [Adiantum nelumboides]
MEIPANPRVSRWSDASSGQPSATLTQVTDNGEKRPPSTAPEPPSKKSRLDSAPTQGGNTTIGYTGDAASGPGGNPEGVYNSRSSLTGHGYGTSSADQGFGASSAYSGERSYGSFAPGSARGSGTGALFFKTKLCTKFKLGSCTFNERCHFAHGVEELRKPPAGWEEMVKQGGGAFNMGPSGRSSEPPRKSNKPCRFYLEGHCPYGDRCTFSHGNEDMVRETAPTMDPVPASNASGRSNYKTRLCTRWEKGELCIYGDKCHFAHGQAELRAYSGGSDYNTGGTGPNYNTGGTGPMTYGDPSMMNAPPMAPPYGAPPNYGNVGVPPPASTVNLNPYPVANPSMNTYGAPQDGGNGYSTNYTYWNAENKWDGNNPAVPAPTPALPTQGYNQSNQIAPWMPNYSADGSYPKVDNNPAPYYNPDLSQQQQLPPLQQLPPQQQQQNVSYYGNSAPTYQDPSQIVNPPYTQGAMQNGDGSAYYSSNYTNQQQGYTGSYNTAA